MYKRNLFQFTKLHWILNLQIKYLKISFLGPKRKSVSGQFSDIEDSDDQECESTRQKRAKFPVKIQSRGMCTILHNDIKVDSECNYFKNS